MGIDYSINYVERPSEVDIFGRESLWGQIDFWTRTIRVYDNGRPVEDLWQVILHELLHGLVEMAKIEALAGEENHDDLDLLARMLGDTLFRNGWIAKRFCSRE